MEKHRNSAVEQQNTSAKNQTILDTTNKNLLVACTFSSEKEAADGALMNSIVGYVEHMGVYPKDGVLYYKTIVNILMELMFNNLKHNILSQEHPANLSIQKEGDHFIINITTIGTKAKYIKLSQSSVLNDVSEQETKKIHNTTLFNSKSVDEDGCGGMGHQVTIRRIKRLFPDAKDILQVSDPIELGDDLVKSELTLKIPVLIKEDTIQEKTPEYADF